MRRSIALVTIAMVGVLLAAGADAKPDRPGKPGWFGQRFLATPCQFIGTPDACEPGSPAGVDTVVAAWVTHQGLPDAGKSDHALLLGKSGETANCAAAGANVWFVNGITLTELGYDVRDDGDCSDTSPRFEVVMTDGLHTIGCAGGVVTETLTDRRGQDWSRKRWTADDLADETMADPPITADSGTVVSIRIVFDDGEDATEESTGRTHLDNIDVNGTLMGKPGLAKAPAQ